MLLSGPLANVLAKTTYSIVWPNKPRAHISWLLHFCRDTKNHTMLSPDRHLGGQLTTNALMFTPPNQFDKPEFARKPLIR